ncbi:MAG: LysR substrate-binding domain-containing protein, partial [Gammaproteobacteria bacterium]
QYLKKAGAPKTPADLAHHNCITWRDHPGHNIWKFRGKDGTSEVRVTGSFFSRSADALAAAAVAGLGPILLPDWNIGIELRQKQLKIVLTDYEAVPKISPVWAVHSHQRHVPPKIRAFIDFLVERFRDARYS